LLSVVPDASGSEFNSERDSSNLSSMTNVGFGLTAKRQHCECGEQGFPIAIGRVNQCGWV